MRTKILQEKNLKIRNLFELTGKESGIIINNNTI